MHKIGDAVQPLGRMKLVSALRINKMTLFNNIVLILLVKSAKLFV